MKQFKITKSITNRDSDAIKDYLKDVSKIPMIDAEEEVRLAKLIELGNKKNATKEEKEAGKKASDSLVTANLRFVISVAKQYQGQGLPLLDLINEGNLGLIRAAQLFDYTKGFKFISYAVWWIRQSIMQSLSTESRTIRLPISQSNSINKVFKTISEFEKKYERTPSDEEISKITGIPEKKLMYIYNSNPTCISIETPFGDEGDEGCLLDVIENKNSIAGDALTKESDKYKNLEILLSNFSNRESDILRMIYGLEGVQELPYEEIGKRFGLTGERIRQINHKLIDTIKNKYLNLAKELL